MKKIALVFVLAVFVPSLVLAWLAVRSLRDQQLVMERQQARLYQGVSDLLAQTVNEFLADQRREFGQQVEAFVAGNKEHLSGFDGWLGKKWPLAQVGFVVSFDAHIFSPLAESRPNAQQFLRENGSFLTNRETGMVYWNAITSNGAAINLGGINLNAKNNTTSNSLTSTNVLELQKASSSTQQAEVSQQAASQPPVQTQPLPKQDAGMQQKLSYNSKSARSVKPEKGYEAGDNNNWSNVESTETEFRQLCLNNTEGALARFLQNKLNVMFWYRPPSNDQMVFGAQLDLRRLTEGLKGLIQLERGVGDEVCAVLLDDNTKPVAMSRHGFSANWKSPFVATEIGETLPHWEIALYLVDPEKLSRSARTVQLTLGLLIAVLLVAIGAGGWLIVSDLRRELTLARQKTDFVSNVSHELKTPLTSIRMFSELLSEGRVSDETKQRSYLSIISAEAARLTRLINNVLDFARLERGEKKYELQRCDVTGVVHDTVEAYRPHLEQGGFHLETALPGQPVFVNGDCDALAQVIVNLLSNAEKYSNGSREIRVELAAADAGVQIRVLDRGPGVPRGFETKIFGQFFRVNDSLSNGVQGSGLGLTLARQIARAHGGDVTYQPRDGGGSCFIVQLPSMPVISS